MFTEAAAHLSVHLEEGFEMAAGERHANERLITHSAMGNYKKFNE